MRLVIYPAIDEHRLERVTTAGGGLEVINAADEATARAAMPEADAFFGKLTPDLLAAAPALGWVQSPTASLEHYVFAELLSHRCVVTNMRGIYSDVIADHVLGFILCFARNLHLYIRRQMEARWEPVGGEAGRTSFAVGPAQQSDMDRAHLHIADQTLGIIGLGGIGREVARRGLALGMRVLAVDPIEGSAIAGLAGFWKPDRLLDLLGESDFVVIAAPHTPETERMIRHTQLRHMKRTAWLINVGRGAIVDLDDLVAALEAREIAGAGLDVFQVEPLPADHPLWRMENVIITPHVAACSPRIAERHLAVLLENVRRFVAGEPLLNVVDKAAWF